MVHEIVLKRYTAFPSKIFLGTEGSYGVEKLKIVRGDGWEDLALDMAFACHGKTLNVVVPADGTVEVPAEATELATRNGKITFRGLKAGARVFTADMEYTLASHGDMEGKDPIEPTPSEVEKIVILTNRAQASAANAEALAGSAREAADAAELSAANAKDASETAAADAAASREMAQSSQTEAAAAQSAAKAAQSDAASAASAAKGAEAAAQESSTFANAAKSAAANAADQVSGAIVTVQEANAAAHDAKTSASASARDAFAASDAATRAESQAAAAEISAGSAARDAATAANEADMAKQIAKSIRDDANAGRFDGAQGPRGEQGPKGDPGRDATIDATLTHAGEAADAKVTGGKILGAEYRISNLEAAARGQLYNDYTESTAAYYKTAPANALPIAEIMSMGGAVTSVRVTGRNLFNKDNAHILPNTVVNASVLKTQKASVETLCIWLPCAPNAQYAVSKLPGGKRFSVGDSVAVPGQSTVLNKATANNNNTSFKYTTSADAKYLVVFAWLASADTVLTKEDVLNSLQVELNAASEYEQYRETVYPIPDAIQSLPGYGWAAGDVYNEVDYRNKKYTKMVGAVDMGTLDWTATSTVQPDKFRMGVKIPDAKRPATNRDVANLSCSTYLSQPSGGGSLGVGTYACFEGVSLSTSGSICVYDERYSSADSSAAFKAAVQGVMLYYELDDPTVTDLSDIVAAPFYINSGVATFEQSGEARDAVPSSIEYAVKLGV